MVSYHGNDIDCEQHIRRNHVEGKHMKTTSKPVLMPALTLVFTLGLAGSAFAQAPAATFARGCRCGSMLIMRQQSRNAPRRPSPSVLVAVLLPAHPQMSPLLPRCRLSTPFPISSMAQPRGAWSGPGKATMPTAPLPARMAHCCLPTRMPAT